MKKMLIVAVAAALFASGAASASCEPYCGTTTDIGVGVEAGAQSNLTIQGGQPSPVIGLPGLPIAGTPPLYPLQSAPHNILFQKMMELTGQIGPIVISGPDDVVEMLEKYENGVVRFTSAPSFKQFRLNGGQRATQLNLTVPPKYSGKVQWIGNAVVESEEGKTLQPPLDLQYIWKTLNGGSSDNLTKVILIPVPKGYNVTVGVRTEGNSLGITSTLAKVVSMFIGVGPSAMTQNGTTVPTGTWAQQYIVFAEDENGIPMTFDSNPPPKPAQPEKPAAAQVDKVRVDALQALKDLRMVATVDVPTQRVAVKRIHCQMEDFIDSKGNTVRMCRGPKGSYEKTEVFQDRATGTSVVTGSDAKK